ncbi:hypothetical protein [Flectobacillus rivi]|uniref:DUF3298 domain-containing protein n=1 Tax=Flectobacillus rivi TaxID=2984209 RepID=A0ABT6Z8E5_9BACT|nr:hypothetical protein [Flectobacillus rivi]MDI9877400.1 hypothetical protein [Flectobacillus rivi]
MKKTLLVLLLILSMKSYSQNLEFYGKVVSYLLDKKGKIYYTINDNPFDSTQYILYDKNKQYRLELSKEEIEKKKIEYLVFSQSVQYHKSCGYKIKLERIMNSSEFRNLNTIKLYTDLLLDINCATSSFYDAKMKNQEKFVGHYSLVIGDTLRHIELSDEFLGYHSQLSKATKNHMSEEIGEWNYDVKKKKLIFNIEQLENYEYNLAESRMYKFEFVVKETSKGLEFKSNHGVLIKWADDALLNAFKSGNSQKDILLLFRKGHTPLPWVYLNEEYIARHLAKFDKGAVRFTSRKSFNTYGTLGSYLSHGDLVFPKTELDKILLETGGNLRQVEQKLGLDNGYLEDEDAMIVLIDKQDFRGLSIPFGNEDGANSFYLPGGYTLGGIPVAILSFSRYTAFKEIKLK